jgi:hypothetical protein
MSDCIMQELKRMDAELERTQCERVDARRELQKLHRDMLSFLSQLTAALNCLSPVPYAIVGDVEAYAASLQAKPPAEVGYESLAEMLHDLQKNGEDKDEYTCSRLESLVQAVRDMKSGGLVE